jgi:amino acid transporter
MVRPQRALQALRFACLAFVLVAGGPFGFEGAVRAAGPLPIFLAFLFVPFFWSLPQALSTAELATHIPDSGGAVIWASCAFNDLAGWIAGSNGLLSSLLDLGLYPALIAQSITAVHGVPLSGLAYSIVTFVAVCVSVGCSLSGLRGVSSFSALTCIFTILPFIISLVWQWRGVIGGAFAWTQVAAAPDWPLFVSTILWSYSGWDSLGTFAGEVYDSKGTYVRGTALTLTAATLSYATPVFVSIQTHPKFNEWVPGSFVTFCGDVSPLLFALAAAASIMSPLATMTASLSASSRAMWALAGGGSANFVRHLPAVLATEWSGVTNTGTPVSAVLFHGVAVLLISGTSFQSLVQLVMAFACVRVAMNTAAFWRLRASRGFDQVVSPSEVFVVPGGIIGALLVAIPQIFVVIVMLYFVGWKICCVAAAFNAAALAIFVLHAWQDRLKHGRWWTRGFLNLASDSSVHLPESGPSRFVRTGGNRHFGSPEFDDEYESDVDSAEHGAPLLSRWQRVT